MITFCMDFRADTERDITLAINSFLTVHRLLKGKIELKAISLVKNDTFFVAQVIFEKY